MIPEPSHLEMISKGIRQISRASGLKRAAHLQTEADKAEPWGCCNLKSWIRSYKTFKDLCQSYVMAYVLLKPLGPIRADDKPKLQRSESPPQGNLPILYAPQLFIMQFQHFKVFTKLLECIEKAERHCGSACR